MDNAINPRCHPFVGQWPPALLLLLIFKNRWAMAPRIMPLNSPGGSTLQWGVWQGLQHLITLVIYWVISLFGSVFHWDQTAPLWSQSKDEINQSPQHVIADVVGDSSLISPYFFVYFWISKKMKWFSLIKTESLTLTNLSCLRKLNRWVN